MIEKINKWLPIITLIAVIALATQLVGGNDQTVGSSGSRFPNGLSADTTSPLEGEVRGTDLTITDDAVISGGSLNVTTSNSATSTIIGGCFQFYATSTATAQKFMASTTPGIMYSSYGTCP